MRRYNSVAAIASTKPRAYWDSSYGVTLSGSDVTHWLDVMAGYDAIPVATAPTINAADASFKSVPSIIFAGSGLVVPAGALVTNSVFSMLCVYLPDAGKLTDDNRAAFGFGSGVLYSNLLALGHWGSYGDVALDGGSAVTNSVTCLLNRTAAANSVTLRKNGSEVTCTNGTTTSPTGYNRIGSGTSAVEQPLFGRMVCCAYWANESISAAKVQIIADAVLLKWGAAL